MSLHCCHPSESVELFQKTLWYYKSHSAQSLTEAARQDVEVAKDGSSCFTFTFQMIQQAGHHFTQITSHMYICTANVMQ